MYREIGTLEGLMHDIPTTPQAQYPAQCSSLAKSAGTIAGATALWRNAAVPEIVPGDSLERNFRFWVSLCVGLFSLRLYPHVYP